MPQAGHRRESSTTATSAHVDGGVLGALELVDDRVGTRPTVAFTFIEVQLDCATEPMKAVSYQLRLSRWHDDVGSALEDEQWRGDLIDDRQG